MSINPVIVPQVYPLPTPKETFSTLAYGESFVNGILGKVYFIDEIFVTGHICTEHEANLYQVLDRIPEYGLHLNKAKCVFFQ